MAQAVAERPSAPALRREDSAPVGRHIRIIVRCLIERIAKDQWQGFTLEFGLAVQGVSAADVRHQLDCVIKSYLDDALLGADREHADELLSRRAPFFVYFRYHKYRLLSRLSSGGDSQSDHRAYREPLALEPRMCSPH